MTNAVLDKETFCRLVEEHQSALYRTARSILSNQQDAEDAVQETFLKVFRHFDDYRHRGHFRAFLYKVAANVCRDLWRKRRWEPVPEQIPVEEKGIREREDREDFKRLVALLPEELREIVVLRFSQELKLKEIAGITGLPARTVQSRLRRALKLLKQELEGRSDGYGQRK